MHSLDMIGVALSSSTCAIRRDAFFEALDKKVKLTRNFVATFSAMEITKKYFDGLGHFKLTITNTDSDPLVSVDCSFEAHVHSSQTFTNEFVERFVQSELRLILTPYARSFVSNLTASMAIPPITLPLSTR